MKIYNGQKTQVYLVAMLATFIVVGLSLFILNSFTGNSNNDSDKSSLEDLDINTPTKIAKNSYAGIIGNDAYSIYSNPELTIYFIKGVSGVNKLLYVYQEKPKERQLTDLFFVHVYVKDENNLKEGVNFINLDFRQKPSTIEVEDTTYYIFQKELTSNSYKNNEIPIDDIAFINTGRFEPKKGRSWDAQKLKLDHLEITQLKGDLDEITITISNKGYSKLKSKRDDALESGVLLSEEEDIIKGQIAYNNKAALDVDLRLKGDWTDHLEHPNKWSYRVIMDGDETLKGMRKFSIQHPQVRNYAWEWLFNKVIKSEGIIGLRYDFAIVNLAVSGENSRNISMGVMAVEEAFDKILIENNKKREGVLLGFDESLLWKDRQKTSKMDLPIASRSDNLQSFENAPIKVFNENKILSDPGLTKQLSAARNLIEGWRNRKLQISEVFDVDLLTTFVALSNLYGGHHGLIWHNLRIYYNPITQKLEPVSFDSNSGTVINELRQYPLSEDDVYFQERLNEKLLLISGNDYINQMFNMYDDELEVVRKNLGTEYSDNFDSAVLEQNSNFIKKLLNPAVVITAGLKSYDTKNMNIEIHNVSELPVKINKIVDTEGRALGYTNQKELIEPGAFEVIKFNLSKYFVNAFVSKKNKKGNFQYPKDLEKLRIAHEIKGINLDRETSIRPYARTSNLDQQVIRYTVSNTPNFEEFDFITKVSDSVLLFSKGVFQLDQNLIIPEGYEVRISAGFEMDLLNSAYVKSESALICSGTENAPIKFYSSDGSGQGIFVTGASKKSVILHTEFDNLSNPQAEMWSVSGAINFHESDVTIENCSFSRNRCEDALNIIRSRFTMSGSTFVETQSDAFDGDFVSGSLSNCTFISSGNDGIDVSGSTLILEDIKIINPSDKGISAGEQSTISGRNIKISGGEIGVVSKDLSKVDLDNLEITKTRLGLSAFQKKSEYGEASINIKNLILNEIEVAHLIEINSILTIDGKSVETVSNNVIDQMYGKEYGKSSR